MHVFVLCLNYTIVTLRFKDNINPLVAVEMDQPDKIIEGNKNASTYSYAYQSLIGFGEAKIIEDLEEKRNALHLLMAHAAKRKNI
ncbi:hypothetical protein ICE98_03734 [Lactococcus lactis]|nr:hypothetical protein [Lactococcus lactis]